MAIHINNRRFVNHRLVPAGESKLREIIDYFVDTPADFNSLPNFPEIAYTSTAFCPSTGEAKTLMSNGWEAM